MQLPKCLVSRAMFGKTGKFVEMSQLIQLLTILLLMTLLPVVVCSDSAIAIPKEQKWLDVPVFYLSERKRPLPKPPVKFPAWEEALGPIIADPGVAQPVNYQGGMGGILHIAIQDGTGGSAEDCSRWGCVEVGESDAHRINKTIGAQTQELFGVAGSFGCSLPFYGLDEVYKQTVLQPFKQAIEQSASGKGIVFIHGCCESQEDSLRKAASLSIAWERPVLLYDWATMHQRSPIGSYVQSVRAIEASHVLFPSAMNLIVKYIDPSRTSLVAHSMGNALVCDYLRHLDDKTIRFDQVHFVKPDMSFPAFFLDWNSICAHGRSHYVYFSTNDIALWFSSSLEKSVPRVGRPNDLALLLRTSVSGREGFPMFIDVSAVRSQYNHDVPTTLLKELLDGADGKSKQYRLEPNPTSKAIFTAVPIH
jgi:pimeloyl-ACP methyl ester carboxylesterase